MGIEEIKKHFNNKPYLKEYASGDDDAIRMEEIKPDIRTDYYRDIDRIIHSLAYNRYSDKTQVFSLKNNDHLSRRMIHVQMVSKIARTIGRALGLNEDLIEAIALGHDLGHTPFGHEGEHILSELSLKYGEGYFNHNIQSVRVLKDIEKNGKGLNMTLQVMDGIMCHNGELELKEYRPVDKTFDKFLSDYEASYRDENVIRSFIPMTLEGCVVRVSDIIGYLGKDIEDAIRLGVISRDDLPSEVINYMGTSNSDIIYSLVMDVIDNSFEKNYIAMSDKMFNILKLLKKFNYEYIYTKANSKEQLDNYKKMFTYLFELYMRVLDNKDLSNDIYVDYLDFMDDRYFNNSNARIVIDFISGMTDDYLVDQYRKYSGV